MARGTLGEHLEAELHLLLHVHYNNYSLKILQQKNKLNQITSLPSLFCVGAFAEIACKHYLH